MAEEGKNLNLAGLSSRDPLDAKVLGERIVGTSEKQETRFDEDFRAGGQLPDDPVRAELDAQAATNQGGIAGSSDDGMTIYTSHPMQNFSLGRFQFENATLKLKGEDLAEFEALLAHPKLPQADRNAIRKLDMSRVDAIVEQRRMATKTTDSSVGREGLEALHAMSPTIGKVDIAHANLPQMDNNMPAQPTVPVDPMGETGLDQGPHIASAQP